MPSKLELSTDWAGCPECWRNFVRSIHDRDFMSEASFWEVVNNRLAQEHNARTIIRDVPARERSIEFTSEQDHMLFLLRWA